jgi:hypothetical protein
MRPDPPSERFSRENVLWPRPANEPKHEPSHPERFPERELDLWRLTE